MPILVFPNIHGIHPAEGRLFIVGHRPPRGGWGAKKNEDGVSVTVCINDGDTHNSPSEQLEAKYPVWSSAIRSARTAAARDTRGAVLAPRWSCKPCRLFLTTRIDRMHCKPWGLEGGGEAAGNSVGIRRNGKWEIDLPNAKIFNVRLGRGDAYMMQSGGGGGFGDPMGRDPELVAEDVREGCTSPAVALNVYGVRAHHWRLKSTSPPRRHVARAKRPRGPRTRLSKRFPASASNDLLGGDYGESGRQ